MIKIIEEVLEDKVLKVKVEAKLNKMARQQTEKYKTKHVIGLLPEKYKVMSCIQEDLISNSKTGNHKQLGEWHFIVEVSAPTPIPQKPPAEKVPTPTVKVATKPSTKTSIRGRMSKIAKEKTNK